MAQTLSRSSSASSPAGALAALGLSGGALLQLRARAEIERRRRLAAEGDPLVAYRYRPADYIWEKLGWEPWSGTDEQPGQMQVVQAYERALRQQHERDAYEKGKLTEDQLTCWRPGDVIRNRIRIEAGHTVGKTKLASGLVNHFFDTCTPSIIYTFAPGWEQIHDLLWKEIKADRRGKGLPGRVLDLRLDRGDEHFATGRATNNAGGAGTERVQGQHGKYLMFVLDEAEGIDDYVYNAVDSMASGGLVIVLLLANPRTRTSRFHKMAERSNVQSFRISCIWHPNVLAGKEVVPAAVRRDYVEGHLEENAERVESHAPDQHTFEVPWRPGEVFKPNAEFMFRVLGIAPANLADNTLIPVGRYEAACRREAQVERPHIARIGVDVARFGRDMGTVYVRHNGRVWRHAQLAQLDTVEYALRIKRLCLDLKEQGVTDLQIRIDGGGGFGGGVVDHLARDLELVNAFPAHFFIWEVHFNGAPHDDGAYADLATEMYAAAGEALHRLKVVNPPGELVVDLCERTYKWMLRQGLEVKKLEPKDDFKKRSAAGRSPDDGDGFILAVAPDFLFHPPEAEEVDLADQMHVSISPV